MEHTVEFIVIVGYLLLLISVSLVFKKFNKDSNDCFRNGCRGTWWLIAVTIFAATMSRMDSDLNGNAATLVKNILPPPFRMRGRQMPGPKGQLRIGQLWTLFCGAAIILIALHLSHQEGKGIFLFMLILGLLIPTSQVPLLLGLFIRKVPSWSALFTMILVWPIGLFMYFSGTEAFVNVPFMADPYKWHWGILLKLGIAALIFILTIPFWKYASAKYKSEVDDFFRLMNTPVDFKKEVGTGNDTSQQRILGGFSIIIGLCISLIMFVPGNSWGVDGRLGILFVGGSVALVGLFLYRGRTPGKNEPNDRSKTHKEIAVIRNWNIRWSNYYSLTSRSVMGIKIR